MVPAIFGCIFGLFGIFTFGIIFVPLAALCAAFGVVSGIVNRKPSTAFTAILAGILAAVGFAVSPSLWLAAAAIVGH